MKKYLVKDEDEGLVVLNLTKSLRRKPKTKISKKRFMTMMLSLPKNLRRLRVQLLSLPTLLLLLKSLRLQMKMKKSTMKTKNLKMKTKKLFSMKTKKRLSKPVKLTILKSLSAPFRENLSPRILLWMMKLQTLGQNDMEVLNNESHH